MIRVKRCRATLAVVFALLAAVLLTGCVSLPRSGDVQEGTRSDSDQNTRFNYIPNPPVQGASAEEIVRGFLTAATGSQNDFKIAREFLSTRAAPKWRPTERVLIYTGRAEVTAVDDHSFSVTVSQTGALDADGLYSPSEQKTTITVALTKQKGQWRIDNPPSGMLISDDNFQDLFTQYPMYFLNASKHVYVPDLRYMLGQLSGDAASAPTRVAKALLSGPAQWLSPAVQTFLPQGTTLRKNVTVQNGEATVDLTGTIRSMKESDLQYAAGQLTQTLQSIASVQSVRILIDGQERQISPPAQVVANPEVAQNPIGYTGTRFGTITKTGVEAIDGLSDRIQQMQPQSVSLSPSTGRAAVQTKTGVYLVGRDISQPVPVDSRAALVTPALDPQGYVWSVPADRSGDIGVGDEKGGDHRLTLPPLPDGAIVSMEVARDGARVLFYVQGESGGQLFVASVVRDSSGVPTGLGPLLDVSSPKGTATDAAWLDDEHIATLSSNGPDEPTTVGVSLVSGLTSELDSVQGGQEIVGGNSTNGLRVVTTAGAMLSYDGTWQSAAAAKLTFLATQTSKD